jgi:membrane-bound ClpP family serine protease
MEIIIIVLLLVAAIILFLVELFLLPGLSVAGILAGGCAFFANYYAFAHLGNLGGSITLAVSVLACVGSLIWFMRSKTLDRIALKKEIKGSVDHSAEDAVRVGDNGVALTRLALIGQAEINGKIVEVRSADGFINEQTPLVVKRIADGVIFVSVKSQS